MKILYLSKETFPSEKSRSLSIMRVCQAFADEGHKVQLVGFMPKTDYAPNEPIDFYGLKGGFEVIRYQLTELWKSRLSRFLLLDGFFLAWKTRKNINQLKPDLIYSRLTITELAFIPSHIPILYEMHSLGPLGQKKLHRFCFRLILKLKQFKRIIVTTDVLANTLKRTLPDIPEVTIARLSADLPVKLQDADIARFKNDHLLGNNFSFHVGYTGYLDTIGLRGTDIIIKTAAVMPEIAFHIVGGEPEVVEYWKNYAQNYAKHGNIFFYGYRNPNEMPYFLNCFDVTLAPLQHRPSERAPSGQNMSPLKLPQYMSYSKAIVASDIPSHRECLINERNALLVTHDDIGQWVSAIELLRDNISIREQIGKSAQLAFYSGFTHQIRTQRILSGLN